MKEFIISLFEKPVILIDNNSLNKEVFRLLLEEKTFVGELTQTSIKIRKKKFGHPVFRSYYSLSGKLNNNNVFEVRSARDYPDISLDPLFYGMQIVLLVIAIISLNILFILIMLIVLVLFNYLRKSIHEKKLDDFLALFYNAKRRIQRKN